MDGENLPVRQTVSVSPSDQPPPRPPAHARPPVPGRWLRPILATAGVFLLAGAAGGWAWQQYAPLAVYVVGEDGAATLDEEQMTQVFGPDGTFVSIGFLAGLVLGGALFWWLKERGPWSVPVIVLGAAAGSGVAWLVGTLLGHDPIEPRLDVAKTGDHLDAPLELHAWTALASWVVGAALAAAVIAATTWRSEHPIDHREPDATGSQRPTSEQSPWS